MSRSLVSARAYVMAGLTVHAILAGIATAEGLSPDQESALRSIARNEPFEWPGLDSSQRLALHEKAEVYWSRYREHHLPHGQDATIVWSDEARSYVAGYDGLGDSALWTGHYMATLAIRYSVEPNEELLADMHAVFDAFDRLSLVSGRDGFVARYAGPQSDPIFSEYTRTTGGGEDPRRPGFGYNGFQGVAPYDGYRWLGDSSRDTYTGLQLALATVWSLCDDPAIRARVQALVERVGTRLVREHFFIYDGQGNLTLPSLHFFVTWCRILLSVCPDRFESLRFSYSLGAWVLLSRDLDVVDIHTAAYYPNNLRVARMFALCLLEDRAWLRHRYENLLRTAYRHGYSDHLNAYFAIVYLFVTADDDPAALATLEGGLLDFPNAKWLHFVDRRGDPAIEMRDEEFARFALLPHERPLREFIWQRPPARAVGGLDIPLEYPALDYLLPYWMARAAAILPPPDPRDSTGVDTPRHTSKSGARSTIRNIR